MNKWIVTNAKEKCGQQDGQKLPKALVVQSCARAKKTGGAMPLFLTAAPAGQLLGTTAESFPEVHH
jgi:hypothetical protein